MLTTVTPCQCKAMPSLSRPAHFVSSLLVGPRFRNLCFVVLEVEFYEIKHVEARGAYAGVYSWIISLHLTAAMLMERTMAKKSFENLTLLLC